MTSRLHCKIKCIYSVDKELSFTMADLATDQVRREARRRRILENSENRLKRITGRYTEKNIGENSNNDVIYSLPKVDNSVSSKILTSESSSILEEKRLNFLEQDKSFDINDYELDDSDVKFSKSDDFYSSDYSTSHLPKISKETHDSIISNSINSQENLKANKSKNLFIFTLLYSPLCSIFLAAFMNVLLLANVHFSVYKSLIVPYLVLALTRLLFQYKVDESKGSSMLVAALILCNIKPEIVHTFKKVLTLISTFSQGFALYITSFTLINWLISLFWNKSNSLNFF
ncbi:uncharacterized protein LOC131672230 [Phymastichus coffea]|uniref:uncharacterized protein LOC131672230 n=1 Tax=Phymastichus coffea TaxID=108790 RepID=UPI00273C2761|nr:uncharacterized protein LOC131672230 [Phymastichus coffea]